MISAQQLFIRWIEFSLAGAVLLLVAKLAVGRLRQPADRINLILMTFGMTAVVPLLMLFTPVPHWQLGLVASEQAIASELPRAAARIEAWPDASVPRRIAEPGCAEILVAPAASPFLTEVNRNALHEPRTTPNASAGPIDPAESPSALPPAVPAIWQFDPWWCAALMLIFSYGIAAVLFLVETIAGARRLKQLANRAEPARGLVARTWREITQGHGDDVRLLVSQEITSPMAYGYLQPTIMIPESIAADDPAALQFCLKHEWTHIENGDLRAWGLTWVCQFLLWFQPLFWMLRRDLRVCQDFLADHRAAGDGPERVEYSALLLSFTKKRMGQPIPGAIAFFDRSSHLSRRIRMLLSSNLTLRFQSPRAFCAGAGILLFVAALVIGAIRLNSVDGGIQAAQPESASQQTKPPAEKEKKENPAEPKNDVVKTIRGSVVDQAGKPVAQAKLSLPLRFQPKSVVNTTADDSGQFELKIPANLLDKSRTRNLWTLWAHAPGHCISAANVGKVLMPDTNELTVKIELPPAATTQFKILTPSGDPLRNALVQPQHYKTPVAYEYVPEAFLKIIGVRTDALGMAAFTALDPKNLMGLQIISEPYGDQNIRVDGEPREAVRTIRLRAPGKIEGKLIGAKPEWIRGVRLSIATDNRDQSSDPSGSAEALTDNEGRFVIPVIASGGPVHTYVGIDPALPVRPILKDDIYLKEGETLKMDIPLAFTPIVHGTIQSKSSGKPVPNAEISVGYGGFRQFDRAVTNDKGYFEARVLPGPVHLQIISMPGNFVQLGTPWASPVQVPDGVEKFELPKIEVVDSHDLSGTLVGEKNEPLSGMELMATDKGRRYGFGKTDAKGRFTMKVPDGVETEFEVYLEKSGSEPATVVQKNPLILRYTADKSEQIFEAERAPKADVTLTGRVLSGGKPLTGVTLTLMRGVPVFSSLVKDDRTRGPYYNASRNVVVSKTETDGEGRYRLMGLKAGDQYGIEIKAPFPAADPSWTHQRPYAPRLSDQAKGDFPLPDLNLRKLSQSLAGVVVDPTGKPVKGAQISVNTQKDQRSIPRFSMSGPPPWTTTDSQGRFKLQNLPEEPLEIFAHIRTSDQGGPIRFPARVPAELNQQNIRVVLDPSLIEKEK